MLDNGLIATYGKVGESWVTYVTIFMVLFDIMMQWYVCLRI